MKKWLFNPFEMLAGWASLGIGLCVIAVTALISFYVSIHLDGVIDLHVGQRNHLRLCFAEGLTNWLCMVLFIYIAGLVFSRSSIRLIDVLGTQAMARFPFLPACLLMALLFNNNVLHFIEYKFLHSGQPVTLSAWDVISFGLTILITLLSVVWMIALMYRAYSVACNVKGVKAILSFAGCLLLAEILSKLLLSYFFEALYE